MPLISSPFRRVGRVLANHVRRLRHALNVLTAQVRAAIARALGQATGDAVRDAVAVILNGPPDDSAQHDRESERAEGLWRQPRSRPWTSDGYDRYEDSDRDPTYYPEDLDDEEEAVAPPTNQPQRSGAWSRAVLTGCHAATWWLRKHPGSLSVIAAVGVGVAAGVAALFASPFMGSVSCVAASAINALALADAARSAAAFASMTVT
jgi:hypothetical protein